MDEKALEMLLKHIGSQIADVGIATRLIGTILVRTRASHPRAIAREITAEAGSLPPDRELAASIMLATARDIRRKGKKPVR